MAERTYKSRKSSTTFTVTGEPSRAYLQVNGEMATNCNVLKQVADIRKGGYDFATVDWMARQLSNTF